eukprot:2863737-Ditylum_brightwellii.AAC.1
MSEKAKGNVELADAQHFFDTSIDVVYKAEMEAAAQVHCTMLSGGQSKILLKHTTMLWIQDRKLKQLWLKQTQQLQEQQIKQ